MMYRRLQFQQQFKGNKSFFHRINVDVVLLKQLVYLLKDYRICF